MTFIEDDDSTHGEHPIDVVELQCALVERVHAVNQREDGFEELLVPVARAEPSGESRQHGSALSGGIASDTEDRVAHVEERRADQGSIP